MKLPLPTKYEYSVETPLNREPPVDELISRFITEDGNFDRNHGPIPHIDPTTHTLSITATDPSFLTTPLQLSADDLRSRFRQHEVVAVLQCAGNRRHTMRTQLREVKGVDWLDGAAMCCVWRGPLLRDVLLAAGAAPPPPSHDDGDGDGLERVDSVVDGAGGGLHVQFASHAARCQEDAWYGASIPLARAMRPEDEVVVAVEMNGAPLKARHGAPVRLVVPGCAGARSVKWVDTIVVQPYESTNHYQQRDYKVLPPECCDQAAAEKWWSRVLALMDMPVNSVVGAPASGSRVSLSHNGTVEVMGYAVPGGGNGPGFIERSGFC
ncbi:putative sulfite oxidase protein [Neofusicoccum parvum UCRNP2]|uniref:Sulfite oxidase, mitochondrial n=2 Tax=Neofusicoccum parvum TaxID=310453 RepID=A0ACB5S2W9_9PEZI|nr:putative sulfite oxidase protein [Neofusicoccum parvum UCRNP2]GME27103.1 putative sulfite oxidase, mitochondrial [Neofusicoccum parvum]